MKKFPVYSEDGREFRVSISEFENWIGGRLCRVTLFRENRRKWRLTRFREVFSQIYGAGACYSYENPDYIALAALAIREYDDSVIRSIEATLEAARIDGSRAAAAAKFTAWDGRGLTDGSR